MQFDFLNLIVEIAIRPNFDIDVSIIQFFLYHVTVSAEVSIWSFQLLLYQIMLGRGFVAEYGTISLVLIVLADW